MQTTTEAPTGLREAKKLQTRRRLVRSARRLALEHGIDGTTVEQVCADAGVSPRTFFNYFESKDAAVVGDAPPLGTVATRRAFVEGGPTGDLLADLLTMLDPSAALEREGRAGLVEVLELTRREPRLLAVHLTHRASHEAELADLVATRRGLPEPDLGCRGVAAAAQTLVHLAASGWFEADDGTSLGDHVERTRAAFVDALR